MDHSLTLIFRVENLSLRLDDMNLKENSIKQLLHSLDHRMARLEDALIVTNQSFSMLHHQVATSQSRESGAESSSSYTPPPPMASRLPVGGPISYPPPPDYWSHGSRLPSSQNKSRNFREARLRPFTDYSRRPRFNRAFSLDAAYAAHSVGYDYTTRAPSFSASKLYLRRKASLDSLSSPDSATGGGPEVIKKQNKHGKKRNKKDSELKVTFGDGAGGKSSSRINGSHSVQYSTAKSKESVTTVSDRPHLSFSTTFDLGFDQSSPPYVPDDLPLPPFSTGIPITPIVTPTHSEYSSITDNIDTSCVNYGSPAGSPQTPRHSLHPEPSEPKKKKQPNAAPTKRRQNSKADQQLKHAEESEHDQMEQMIRKRIRQISLTESDSLGDMAKHVMQDIDLHEEKPADIEYFSGDEGSKPSPLGLKSVKSDPNFRFTYGSPSDAVVCGQGNPLSDCEEFVPSP